ncbi:hypothetical protein GCM10027176_12300 [Actinoallomurus bryophytorum]
MVLGGKGESGSVSPAVHEVAEGLAGWAKNRHMPPDYRADAMAEALSIGTNKRSTGALFDGYYTSLLHGLEPRPL